MAKKYSSAYISKYFCPFKGFQTRENVSTRRSRKVKNLEKEVEMILSQDESEEEAIPNPSYEPQLPKTPTTTRRRAKSAAGVMCTPRASETVLQDMLQTPRRSCRKSIKPPQDYDDIIVRQSTRSAKKRLTSLGEEAHNEENELCPVPEDGINVGEQTKWSTANVGRSSTKRSARKSKRGTRGKRNLNEETKMEDENVHIPSNKNEEMVETVHIDVDVNATIDESKNPVVNSPAKQNKEMVVINEQKLSEENKIQETPESESSVKAANPDERKVCLMLDELKATRETMEVDEQEKTEDIRLIQEDEDTNADNIKLITEQNNVIVLDDEQVEEEIHLLQEDTEDCKEFPSVSNNSHTSFTLNQNENKDSKNPMAEKDTCLNSPKVEGRNKLSKLEIDTSKTTLQSNEQDAKDYFGCYLKSKEIDIEDLGLNPLNDDEDEKKLNEVQLLPSTVQQDINEEMPSLIVCDDEEENLLEQPEEEKTKLNVTFDAGDSVVVVPMDENTSHSVHSEMDVLQMSEDEECQGSAKKVPRIMLTTTEEQNQTLLSTPPQQKKKPYRHPTPYRNRSDSKVKKEINTGSAKKLPMSRENLNSSAAGFTTMTPREIVLRGIRKRSMSVCLGADEFSKQRSRLTRSAKKTLQKAVNFYSPANQTTIIDDLDKLIEKSVKKNAKQISEINNKNKSKFSCDFLCMYMIYK